MSDSERLAAMLAVPASYDDAAGAAMLQNDAQLLDVRRRDGASVGMLAAANGWRHTLNAFLEVGGNASHAFGNTTLLTGVIRSSSWTPHWKLYFVEKLLEHGADPNARSALGGTALLEAINSQQLEIAKMLAAYSADVGTAPTLFRSPVSVAANFGYLPELEWLLAHHAWPFGAPHDPFFGSPSPRGRVLLDHARARFQLLALLHALAPRLRAPGVLQRMVVQQTGVPARVFDFLATISI